MELSMRTDGAEDVEVARTRAALDMVKTVGGNTLTGIQGIYTFIWAKTAALIAKSAESVRLLTTTQSSRLTATELSVKMLRPESESEFFERIYHLGAGFAGHRQYCHHHEVHQGGGF